MNVNQQRLGLYIVTAPSYDLMMELTFLESHVTIGLPYSRYTGRVNGLCGRSIEIPNEFN